LAACCKSTVVSSRAQLTRDLLSIAKFLKKYFYSRQHSIGYLISIMTIAFLSRRAMHNIYAVMRCPSVRLSELLSVTFAWCQKRVG